MPCTKWSKCCLFERTLQLSWCAFCESFMSLGYNGWHPQQPWTLWMRLSARAHKCWCSKNKQCSLWNHSFKTCSLSLWKSSFKSVLMVVKYTLGSLSHYFCWKNFIFSLVCFFFLCIFFLWNKYHHIILTQK